MPKLEWGVKRVCPVTGKRFYDLNRSPIVSPYTGEIVPIDVPGRKGGFAVAEPKAKAVLAADMDGEEVLIDDEDVAVEADDELLEAEDDENVSFDELSDVPGEEEEP